VHSQPGAGDRTGRPRRRPATSVDVARRAGVSRATVSHVLNGQTERFHPDTVERVREAAAELGYVRSAAGRALVMGRSDVVLLAVPRTGIADVQTSIEAVSADLAGLGFMSVVHFRVSEAERVVSPRLHRLVAMLRPAGVVDFGGLSRRDVEQLEEDGCPVLPESDRPEANGNHGIGRLQAEHLCAQGYRRIACAFQEGTRDDAYGYARYLGAAQVCAAAGVPLPEVLELPDDRAAVRRSLRRLLATAGSRLAVAAYDDGVARELLEAADELGLAVPERLAVVGAHGTDRPRWSRSPALTSLVIDVGGALKFVRQEVVAAYGGPGPEREPTRLDDVFRVLPGGTT
jgi:DNA-binding LacI/PurR family transcriptional regulator